ncbi:peptidoglycan DD-metalloendopeptidase family protein [Aquicoccus sp. SCR17]|nr:peptidoglycan DD-metalloendopeptidase family protein [Carideicomes alvinocaridis]
MTRPDPVTGRPAARLLQLLLGATALTALAACQDIDYDMRGRMGGPVDTSAAAQQASGPRPQPDARGIISYPNYQVAVARRGDTLAGLAQRIGANPQELARYNGIQTGDVLREGEVIALPGRVAEPTGGPIQPPGSDITTIASAAIDRADEPSIQTSTLPSAPQSGNRQASAQTGVEPVRHRVERGETAYTIARLYNVSVRSLAEWNGLNSDFSVREGQYLLIPVPDQAAPEPQQREVAVTQPGQASPTPPPPSAAKPLPQETPPAASEPIPEPESPDLAKTQTEAPSGAMAMPVQGKIIREYSKGRTDGIDISASAGSAVSAAASGKVGAITSDSSGKNIVVVKHPDGLLTVYANVANIAVSKNDSVSRGQKLAEVASGDPAYVRFGVYKGSDSVDPAQYLN